MSALQSSARDKIDIDQKEAAARACMLRARAALAPPGPEREALLKEARACDVAAHIHEIVASPGLRSPTG